MAAEAQQKKPPACSIVRLVVRREAITLVRRFKDGDGTRKLAKDYGLSRTGVEELIRSFGWLRGKQKVHAK